MRWMKCFNFAKHLEEPISARKNHKKQRSADLAFLNSRPEIIHKYEYCPSLMSQCNFLFTSGPKKNKKKKIFTINMKQKNKETFKKHKKRKSADLTTKKSCFLKKKNTPLPFDIFRSSKLASIKSVDCSLVDSTIEEEVFECNYTENVYSKFEP